jgi:hypothetical protein
MTTKLSYYSKKVDAVSHWKQLNINSNEQHYLFQMDKEGTKGAKQFIVGTLDLIWDLLKSGKNNIYESWEDMPIHFAFDIDFTKTEDTIYNNVKIHVQQIVVSILQIATQMDIDLNIDNIVVLENENQHDDTIHRSKYSFHIIFRGLVMESYIAASKFYDNLTGIDLEGCDKSIYRKTCFRTCFSSKLGKNETLVPLVLKIGNKTTDNENNYDTLKDFWKSTLICNTEDYTIVYNEEETNQDDIVFEETTNKSKPVDLSNIEKILMSLPLKYSDEYFYWSKIGMILRNLNQEPDRCLDIFDKFSKKSTNKYKNKTDIIKHWKTFKDNRKNKISVGTLFLWCKEEKISFTNNKGLDSIVNEYPSRTLDISHDVKDIHQRYFPIEELESLWGKKLIGIQSEKGTGKTTTLFKYMFEQNKISAEDSILFISSRRTFGIKLLGDIKKYGFKLYSDCKEYQIEHNRMICQLDSILRLNLDKFKYIIIDECESLMRYITSSHFTKNIKANLIVSSLESKIIEAEKVIIMDADLCDRSINYIKNILNIDDSDVKLIVNKFQPYNDYTIKYMAYSTWLKVLIDKLDNNKKVVIPTASNNQAKDLNLLIQSHYPDKKILLIHRETNENEKLDQVINVNEKWSKYDVIIYTPSVCMGISFDNEYFDHIFAYGCENSLGSQEFCQMLHRIRKPKEQSIYLGLDKFVEYDSSRHVIGMDKIQEIICYDYYLTHFDLHNNLITKKYIPNTPKDSISKLIDGSGGSILILPSSDSENNENNNDIIKEKKFNYPYQNEPIYKVYLKNSQELISDRLNFGNQLFGYFKMKGYKLEKHEWEDGEMIKNEIKEIRELRREEEMSKEIDGIYNASDINDDQFKDIMNKRKEDISQDDIYKLQKRNFKKCYILDEVNKEIICKYKDISVMKYYHNLSVVLPVEPTDTIKSRLEDIRLERVNNPYLMNAYNDLTIKNSYTKHMWANKIIESLGFSLLDLETRLPVQTVEDIIDNEWIKDTLANSSIEYFVNKFNIAFPKKSLLEMDRSSRIKFASKIIESQYGLTIMKDSSKNYYLSDNKKWDELYEYRNKKSGDSIKLKDKIVKKAKDSINIDQSWFEE